MRLRVAMSCVLLPLLAPAVPGQDGGFVRVSSHDRFADGNLSFTGRLAAGDEFGASCAVLGDLNRDGHQDVAVGAPGTANGGLVWILLLDGAGRVKGSFRGVAGIGHPRFGTSVTGPGDVNGDGTPDLLVGAPGTGRGPGAVALLFLNANGSIKSSIRIANPGQTPGFGASLAFQRGLGTGVGRLFVAAPNVGATNGEVWLMDLTKTGGLAARPTAIRSDQAPLKGLVGSADRFGRSVGYVDVDSDGDGLLAVGAPGTGGTGAVWLLELSKAGLVTGQPVIVDNKKGLLRGRLTTGCGFGRTATFTGDLDGDGHPELCAGAPAWSQANDPAKGILFVLSVRPGGEVFRALKLHHGTGGVPSSFGGFTAKAPVPDFFGSGAAAAGDLDGNGIPELLVGARRTKESRGELFALRLEPARAHGLAVRPLGNAVLGATKGGGLLVSNIGSSGMDGVRYDCGKVSGFELRGGGTTVMSEEVIVVVETVKGTVDNKPGTLIATNTFRRTSSTSLTIGTDFSPIAGSGLRYTISLWRNGKLVTRNGGGVNGTIVINGGGVTVRSAAVCTMRKKYFTAHFKTGLVALGGKNWACDGVLIAAEGANRCVSSIDSVEARYTAARNRTTAQIDEAWVEHGQSMIRAERARTLLCDGKSVRAADLFFGGGGLEAKHERGGMTGNRVTTWDPILLDLDASLSEVGDGMTVSFKGLVGATRHEIAKASINNTRAASASLDVAPSFPGLGNVQDYTVTAYSRLRRVAHGLVKRGGSFSVSGVSRVPDFVGTMRGFVLRMGGQPQARVAFGNHNVAADTVVVTANTTTAASVVDGVSLDRPCPPHCGHVTILKIANMGGGGGGGGSTGPLEPIGRTADPTPLWNQVLFAHDDGTTGTELWATDGTREGTRQVKDIRPGLGVSGPRAMVTDFNRTYFVANDGRTGDELWMSDGTPQGTLRIADIRKGPAGSGIERIVVQRDWRGTRLWFVADDGVHGPELWTSDTTAAGTRLVRDVRPGALGSAPANLAVVDEGAELALWCSADDGKTGREPYRADSLASGFSLVADIRPGPGGSNPRAAGCTCDYNSSRSNKTHSGIALIADDGKTGNELWLSDGTRQGTRLLLDINKGPAGSNPSDAYVFANGSFYFAADDGVHGRELWRSDRTARGTRMIADIRKGPQGSNPVIRANDHNTTRSNKTQPVMGFTADDGIHGSELWWTNGTVAALLWDRVPGPKGSAPASVAWVGSSSWIVRSTSELGKPERWLLQYGGSSQRDCARCIARGGTWRRWGQDDYYCFLTLDTDIHTLEVVPNGTSSGQALVMGIDGRQHVMAPLTLDGVSLPVGVASPGMTPRPSLYADDARIGDAPQIAGTAPRGSFVVVFGGAPAKELALGDGRYLYWRIFTTLQLAVVPVGNNENWNFGLAIPDDPAFVGLRLGLQAMAFDLSLRLAFSNGVHMNVGR